jgi:hypothetical protein
VTLCMQWYRQGLMHRQSLEIKRCRQNEVDKPNHQGEGADTPRKCCKSQKTMKRIVAEYVGPRVKATAK